MGPDGLPSSPASLVVVGVQCVGHLEVTVHEGLQSAAFDVSEFVRAVQGT